jgi:hypothetical protein
MKERYTNCTPLVPIDVEGLGARLRKDQTGDVLVEILDGDQVIWSTSIIGEEVGEFSLGSITDGFMGNA